MSRIRAMVAAVCIVGTLGLAAAPAGAAIERHATGPVAGYTFIDFAPPCNGGDIAFQHFVLAVDLPGRHDAILAIDACISYTFFVTRGTFAFGSARGFLTGTVSGSETAGSIVFPIDFTLTVTGATRRFARTHGTLHFVGEFSGASTPWQVPGNLTAALSRRHRS